MLQYYDRLKYILRENALLLNLCPPPPPKACQKIDCILSVIDNYYSS